MSELSSLSHEYASTSDFSRAINDDVLLLKKQLVGSVHRAGDEVTRQSKMRLGDVVAQLLIRLGASNTCDPQRVDLSIPEDIVVRIEDDHRNDLEYFVSDLKGVAHSLASSSPLNEDDLKLLDTICKAADASASATFRKLWRR